MLLTCSAGSRAVDATQFARHLPPTPSPSPVILQSTPPPPPPAVPRPTGGLDAEAALDPSVVRLDTADVAFLLQHLALVMPSSNPSAPAASVASYAAQLSNVSSRVTRQLNTAYRRYQQVNHHQQVDQHQQQV